MSHETPRLCEISQKLGHEQPSTQVAPGVVQYIPIPVSEIQTTNDEGRTICKVIGCLEEDNPHTKGFCTEHHDLFFRASSTNQSDESADWICVCGENVSGKKKRCWNCSKWRSGKKNTSTNKRKRVKKTKDVVTNCTLGAVSVPESTGNHMTSDRNIAKDVSASKRKKKDATLDRLDSTSPSLEATNDLEPKNGKRKRNSEIGGEEYLVLDEDITKERTSLCCASRWGALLSATHQRKKCNFTSEKDNGIDPFDCSDLIVPSNTEIIEKEVAIAIQKWNDLDSRIVLEDDGVGLFDGVSASADDSVIIDGTMVGDGRRQRLMPPNFDYKCSSMSSDGDKDSGTANSDPEHQDHYRLKVISLIDPNQTLDYENELWHIFKSMPTAKDYEKRYGLFKDDKQNGESFYGLQHTFEVKQNLKTLMTKYTRMDAHSLGRLRIRDRHSPPSIVNAQQLNQNIDFPAHAQHLETSIRFEILRYSDDLTRGHRRDSTRLEVEFAGSSSTLLDIHRAIVECARGSDGISNVHTKTTNSMMPNGVFFIENKFYTHGISGEDAARAIMVWLDGNQSENTEKAHNMLDPDARRKHLHISASNSLTSMSKVYLEQLPFRLGIRYVHLMIDPVSPARYTGIYNESAVFVTDIQTHKLHERAAKLHTRAPTIYDKWAPLNPTTFCLACKTAVATVVTMNDEMTSTISNGTPMCSSCFRDLHYKSTSESIEDMLRDGPAHQSFRVLPVGSFNCYTVYEDMKNISGSDVFKRTY